MHVRAYDIVGHDAADTMKCLKRPDRIIIRIMPGDKTPSEQFESGGYCILLH